MDNTQSLGINVIRSQSTSIQPIEQVNDKQVTQNIHTLGHQHDAHGHLFQELNNRDVKAEKIYQEIESNKSQQNLKQEQEGPKNQQKEFVEQHKEKQKQFQRENSESLKIEKQIDYETANSMILQERESKWQKLSQQQHENFQFNTPKPHENQYHPVPPVQPFVKESLSYTNNMPVIEKQRNIQTEEVPQSFFKKIGAASVITAAYVGGFVLGKVDKSIIGLSGVLVFGAAYLMQK